jgi:superfamily II DNA or RNA helicase
MAQIPVTLTNRYARFTYASPEAQVRLKSYFRYRRPNYQFTRSFIDGSWDGYTNLMQYSRVGTGLFLACLPKMEEKGWKFAITDRRVFPMFRDMPDPPTIRPYQKQAVDAMIDASNTGGLILSATGSGKTRTLGYLFRRLEGCGCFIVDELALMTQAQKELANVLEESVGIVGHSEFRPSRITVATIQTLHRHRGKPKFQEWFASLEVVVLDEIHVQLNRRNIDIIHLIQPKAVFGLTATLEMAKRHVRLPAMNLAGPPIFEYSIHQGVEEGYLCKGTIYFAPCRFKATPTNYEHDYAVCITHNRQRNELIADLTRAAVHCGRRVIVVGERIPHIKKLSVTMQDIPHRIISGAHSAEERADAIKAMNKGKLRLIIASRVFGKGIDVPAANTIIDVGAGAAENSAIQKYGRGTRMMEDKTLVHIDIADRGNRFEDASWSRRRALVSLGMPYKDLTIPIRIEEIFGRDQSTSR